MNALPQPRQAQSLALILQKIGEPLFAEWRPGNVAAHRVDAWDLNQLPQQFDRIKRHDARYDFLGRLSFKSPHHFLVFSSTLHACHSGF
jgi:hypothetical protein